MFPAHIKNEIVQTCTEHCRQTALITSNALKAVGLENTGYLAGLLHDAGKFTNQFSTYITAAASGQPVKKDVIHSFAGVYYLLRKYQSSDNEYDKMTAQLIAYAIGAHHGSFDCFNENKENAFEHRLSKQPEYEEAAINNFLKECISEEQIHELFLKSSGEIARMFNNANELVEIDESGSESYFYLGLIARLIASALVDGDRKDTAAFMNGTVFPPTQSRVSLWDECLSHLENYLNYLPVESSIQIARKEMSDYCRQFADNQPGVYRLNLPTGGGKTLSGMRYALAHAKRYDKKRIIYAAPFISIIEQNAKVIKDAVGNAGIVLEHHSNILREKESENEISQYDLLTETWDAPIIVTTLVQLLNTMFSGKTSSIRRFHTLSDSVIIIDEIQSVPTKMLSLFNLAVNFLSNNCETTVLLCSATQPCFEDIKHKMIISEEDIIPVEKAKEYRRLFKRTELIDAGSYRLDEIPAFVIQVLSNNSSLLVICNTKKEAQLIFDGLRAVNAKSFHLSASMCMEHRKNTLKDIQRCLESGEKTVCVATQVIEAGIDVSFESVIRLSAGIDNIVQAAGRCNRNGESETPKSVFIVRCIDENLNHLNDIQSSQNAYNNLLEMYALRPQSFLCDLASDESVKFYYNNLYGSFGVNHFDYPNSKYPTLYELLSSNDAFRDGASNADRYYVCQAFKTAGSIFDVIDNDSISVIVPYGEGLYIINSLLSERALHDISFAEDLIQKAKEYSVAVSDYQLTQLAKQNIVKSYLGGRIFVLQPEYYDNNKGLVSVGTGEEVTRECSTLIL